MEQKKNDSEILAEIYRNAQIALTSISDIMPEVEDGGIREEIMREHEEYEKVCSLIYGNSNDSWWDSCMR